jgi:hypothetical protein
MLGIFSVTGCRDFKDFRTPYKSFVAVKLVPINQNGAATTDTAMLELLQQCTGNKFLPLQLDPNVDHVIHTLTSGVFPKTLTVHYQREVVLVSHQFGGTYKYTLKEITSNFDGKYKIINKELSTLNASEIDLQIYF